jgi:Exonuclease VII, large subunit
VVEKEIITLFDLQCRIGEAIENSMSGKYWVKAETGEVKINSSGHCYIDLIYKEDGDSEVKARLSAIIWASTFKMLKPYFETTTGRSLERGMNILVCVHVQYSALYGLSLVISDIDSSFTIGEQEMLRAKTIQRLKEEGMMDMNSTLEMSELPRRVAVISSETAAGYRDFVKHLLENEYGFKFYVELFQSPMQGESAPSGIISALDAIALRIEEFDLVMIIRGGGSVQDLIPFDDYDLAVNIAQFPLPVVTGIGHDHDFHVADMVAYRWVKTPTAAADFIVDIFVREEQQLIFLSKRVSLSLQNKLTEEDGTLQRFKDRLASSVSNFFLKQSHIIELLEQRIESGNPLSLLKRGYSMALKDGERIVSWEDVSEGDSIMVLLSEGVLECTVDKSLKGLSEY